MRSGTHHPEGRLSGQSFDDMGRAEAHPDWSDAPYTRHMKEMPYEVERRERERVAALARKYGLQPADIVRMEAEAGGKCALCGRSAKLHVDHDHATGRVRALLCPVCNMLLGRYEADPELFMAVIAKFPAYVAD